MLPFSVNVHPLFLNLHHLVDGCVEDATDVSDAHNRQVVE